MIQQQGDDLILLPAGELRGMRLGDSFLLDWGVTLRELLRPVDGSLVRIPEVGVLTAVDLVVTCTWEVSC